MNFETFNADDTFDFAAMVDAVEATLPEQTDEEGEE